MTDDARDADVIEDEAEAVDDGLYSRKDTYKALIKTIRDHQAAKGDLSMLLARKLFRAAMRGLFLEVLARGRVGFPKGLGALRLRRVRPMDSIKMPNGTIQHITRDRAKIQYEMGTSVERRLGYAGNYKYEGKRPDILDDAGAGED